MKFKLVIKVVINIGWSLIVVFLIIEFISFFVLSNCCLMNDSIISLFNIVIFERVINLIVVEIERGMFFNYKVNMLFVSVKGILLNMIRVFFIELNVMISSVKIINNVVGIMMDNFCVVFLSCLNVLLYLS